MGVVSRIPFSLRFHRISPLAMFRTSGSFDPFSNLTLAGSSPRDSQNPRSYTPAAHVGGYVLFPPAVENLYRFGERVTKRACKLADSELALLLNGAAAGVFLVWEIDGNIPWQLSLTPDHTFILFLDRSIAAF